MQYLLTYLGTKKSLEITNLGVGVFALVLVGRPVEDWLSLVTSPLVLGLEGYRLCQNDFATWESVKCDLKVISWSLRVWDTELTMLAIEAVIHR